MKAVYAFCTDRNGPDSYDFADCEPQAELVDKASGMRQIKSQVFLADLQADLLNLKETHSSETLDPPPFPSSSAR